MFELLIIVCVTVGFYRQARIQGKKRASLGNDRRGQLLRAKIFNGAGIVRWDGGYVDQVWQRHSTLVSRDSPERRRRRSGLRPRGALLDRKMAMEKARTRCRNRNHVISFWIARSQIATARILPRRDPGGR